MVASRIGVRHGFAPEVNAARVRFAEPQYGVAPGRVGVFYTGERVLGGGWFAREEAGLAA